MELVLAVILGVILVFVIKYAGKARMTVNNDQFQQYGVIVNFKTQKIIIKGKAYNVNQVTGIKMVNSPSLGDGFRRVEIELDDFSTPVQRITVPGVSRARQEFAQRLAVAIRRAGGPSFT